jgi:hypothetical protein
MLWVLANVHLYGRDDPAAALPLLEQLAERDHLGLQCDEVQQVLEGRATAPAGGPMTEHHPQREPPGRRRRLPCSTTSQRWPSNTFSGRPPRTPLPCSSDVEPLGHRVGGSHDQGARTVLRHNPAAPPSKADIEWGPLVDLVAGDADMAEAARLFLELQEQRHAAGYDRGASVDKASLLSACQDVEVARAGLGSAAASAREAFWTCWWFSDRICGDADLHGSGDGQGTGTSRWPGI